MGKRQAASGKRKQEEGSSELSKDGQAASGEWMEEEVSSEQ
jgi:hypothetical protein